MGGTREEYGPNNVRPEWVDTIPVPPVVAGGSGQTMIWVGVRRRDEAEEERTAAMVREVCILSDSCTVCAILGRRTTGRWARGPFRFCDADVSWVVALEKEVDRRRYHDA